MTKGQERIERCLAVVDVYEASEQNGSVWALSNGVALRELASWCGHARRWRSRLQGTAMEPAQRAAPTGFVAATVPTGATTAVRLEWPTASGSVTLHWPMSHVRELGRWSSCLAITTCASSEAAQHECEQRVDAPAQVARPE